MSIITENRPIEGRTSGDREFEEGERGRENVIDKDQRRGHTCELQVVRSQSPGTGEKGANDEGERVGGIKPLNVFSWDIPSGHVSRRFFSEINLDVQVQP